MMRRFIIALLGLFVLSSCSQNADSDSDSGIKCCKGEEHYSDAKGTVLNLTKQEWHLKKNGLGGVDVGVVISGSTNGDSATIRTYGDGLIYDLKIGLNSRKEFKQEASIFFTSSPLTEDKIIAPTLIMVFRGQDTLKVEIQSCQLQSSY